MCGVCSNTITNTQKRRHLRRFSVENINLEKIRHNNLGLLLPNDTHSES